MCHSVFSSCCSVSRTSYCSDHTHTVKTPATTTQLPKYCTWQLLLTVRLMSSASWYIRKWEWWADDTTALTTKTNLIWTLPTGAHKALNVFYYLYLFFTCMTPKLILTRYIILGLSFLCFWLFWWSLGGRTQRIWWFLNLQKKSTMTENCFICNK